MGLRLDNPSAVPGKKPRGVKAVDKQRISTCKVCHLGVYDSDQRVWARGQIMGICHTECVEAEEKHAQLLAELTRERFGGAA